VLTEDNQPSVWGSNEFYQLSQPQSVPNSPRPTGIGALAGLRVLQIACGGSHSLALVAQPGASAGSVYTWGTGTVGQNGLGSGYQILNGPVALELPATPAGKPALATKIFAGLVSSACLTESGDCFVWGDASAGRLGLPNITDKPAADPSGPPHFVNGSVVWTPQLLRFTAADVGNMSPGAAAPKVVSVALGGSFSLFLLQTGAATGGVLLASGCLGVDITRDVYGYPGRDERKSNADIDDEVRSVPRRPTPTPVAPFGTQPKILKIYAGARHAAVIVNDDTRGSVPRLYTAGKGWLGHPGTADSVLLEKPTVAPAFAPVSGALQDIDVVEAGCGHSHTLALTSDGRVFAWGRGDSGELGHGNLSDRSLPIQTRSMDGHYWSAVAAGSYYSVAVAAPGFKSPAMPSMTISEIVDQQKAMVAAADAAAAALSAPPPAPAPAPAPVAAAKGPAAKGGDAKKAKEDAAKERARADLDAGELPPKWSWEQTDDGEIYYIRPDGET
jgi:alpha-tubulin suppressor-like RCC1 family protein